MSLRKQLYGICGIFLLPILFLAGLLAVQARTAISFSEKERTGAAYLLPVFSMMSQLAAGNPTPNLKPLEAASAQFDADLKTWESATQFHILASRPEEPVNAVSAGVRHIAAIGDGSNLVLDPDLDSYYVMDSAVIRIPELLLLLTRLDRELAVLEKVPQHTHSETLVLLNNQIATARQGLGNATLSALKNNPSGEIARAVMGQFGQLNNAIERQEERISALLVAQEGRTEQGAIIAAARADHKKLAAGLGKAHSAYLVVLDKLLQARISSKNWRLFASLAGALATASIAMVLALIAARSVRNNVASLSTRIRAMTKGDYSSPIPLQDHKDELGSIARSLTSFRAHAEEKAELSETILREREEAAEQLHRIAFLDDLTELPNRKFLGDAIERHIAAHLPGEASALFYFDLDGFKDVNDTYTHVAGDLVLQEIARRLATFGGEEDVVARLGGDEFAIFIKSAGQADDLLDLSRAILQRVAEPIRTDGTLHFLSSSVGVAVMELINRHDASELIRRSDVAMYRAKALGKNQTILFDATFDSELLRQKEIEQALREAVKHGDVKLAFQPQFDVDSGKLIGVEGLARWTHPRLGQIAPSTFIPIAERCGLIHKLGRQIMHQAVAAYKRWPNLKISVNVSVAQLRHHQFMNDITAIVAEMEGPLSRFEMEITESMLMDANPVLAARLQALRDIGFELALDDFGTGFSSLGYLSRYRFDRLKIDRAFVVGALDSPRGAALLKSIANLGRSLGMDVCAEGVETFESVQHATEAGCTSLQGFYFSPAVSVKEIDEMLKAVPQSGADIAQAA